MITYQGLLRSATFWLPLIVLLNFKDSSRRTLLWIFGTLLFEHGEHQLQTHTAQYSTHAHTYYTHTTHTQHTHTTAHTHTHTEFYHYIIDKQTVQRNRQHSLLQQFFRLISCETKNASSSLLAENIRNNLRNCQRWDMRVGEREWLYFH